MSPFLPKAFLESLEGVSGFERENFEKAHLEPSPITSIRLNPLKYNADLPGPAGEEISSAVPWCSTGYYLKKRPSFTFDPLFHAGAYYVQEASSMFLEQAFRQLTDLSKNLKVLDVSAAPGGKSTHIQSLISENSLLVSNEVIRNRAFVLKENIIRWGAGNVIVSSNDPSAFRQLPGFFDVVVVDAPCSGSGLFRKDPAAIGEWSLDNVALCSQRQQRILASVLPALKQGGLLIYSTCSYSLEENEAIGNWLADEGMENEKLETPSEWNIVQSRSGSNYGYRFYPYNLSGEGFYLSCFRKTGSVPAVKLKPKKPQKAGSVTAGIIGSWANIENREIVMLHDIHHVIPDSLTNDFHTLSQVLYLHYAGTAIGKLIREKLVPEHALALSYLLHPDTATVELDYESAIKYLQKQDFDFPSSRKGWQTVHYKGNRLGWVNVLPGRINNYYPRELRILKQQNL